MKVDSPEAKDELNRRLRRLEGQVRGVQKMVDDGRDCKEIVQQLVAIRSAVQGASQTFMQSVASECLLNLDPQNPAARSAAVSDLISLLGKTA